MGKRARKGGLANHALRAIQASMAAETDAARRTGKAVELAVRDAPQPPEARIPPEMHGPLEIVALMAAPVLAKRWGLPASEENLQNIIKCLVQTWTEILAYSNREHYDAWLSQNQGLSPST